MKHATLPFLAATTATFFSGCKSLALENAASAPAAAPAARMFSCSAPAATGVTTIRSGSAPTFAYHWTNDDEVLTPSGLSAWLAKRFSDARSTPLEDSANTLGDGLYLASNPVTTAGLGRILVLVPLKPNCTYAVAANTDWEASAEARAALDSPAAGVMYEYESDEKAVVVRDPSAVDLTGVTVMDTSRHEGDTLESIAPKRFSGALAWKDAVDYYGATYSFLAHTLASEKPKLRDAKGALTDLGYALALRSELESGGQSREKALDSLLASGSSIEFPLCGRREEHFPFRGSKFHGCVAALSESIAVHAAPELASSVESPMSVEEAHKVLIALGYAGQVPAVTQAQTPFFKGFFANWKSVKGKQPAAGALIEASLLFGEGPSARRIEDWAR